MNINKINWLNIYIPVVALTLVSAILAVIKVRSGASFMGDTGNYYILLENIHKGLGPYNQFMATLVDYSYIDKIHSMSVVEFCKTSFNSIAHSADDFNHFKFHFYPILYPISTFLYLFEAPYVTHFVDIFSFFSFLYLAYFILLKNQCGYVTSFLVTVLISTHPAWSWSIQGAPFPDRIYLPFGLLAFYLIDFKNSTKYGLLALSICGTIVEKVILYSGIFLILHTLLFYKKNRNIAARLAFGLFMILVFELLKRYQLTSNPYYESFINLSPGALLNLFKDSYFFNGALSFLLVNLPFLLVILIKSPRLFIITFAMMVPNIIGNIGGAEKTGYFTHYHTLYFPFLVYSFCISFGELIKDMALINRNLLLLKYPALLFTFVFFSSINFSELQKIKLAFNDRNLYTSYFSRIYKDKNNYDFITSEINKNIPKTSKISSVEGGWPYLYQHLNSAFLPYEIDTSDFLIVYYSESNGKYIYSGVSSFNGVEATNAMNVCLNTKIENAKFNTGKPIKLNGSLAILGKE
jgi:hypothetical protein